MIKEIKIIFDIRIIMAITALDIDLLIKTVPCHSQLICPCIDLRRRPYHHQNWLYSNHWAISIQSVMDELCKVWLLTKYTESNLEASLCSKLNTKETSFKVKHLLLFFSTKYVRGYTIYIILLHKPACCIWMSVLCAVLIFVNKMWIGLNIPPPDPGVPLQIPTKQL